MNLNSQIKIFLLCPIPEEQKPINEYIRLKESFVENTFLNWVVFSKKKDQQKILLFSISFLFLNFFFPLFSSFQIISLFFFLLLVIFIQWVDIKKRFEQSRIFYEEASWYDGQIWEKPLSVLKNDKLISTQKIDPLLNKMNFFFLRFFGLTFLLSMFLV